MALPSNRKLELDDVELPRNRFAGLCSSNRAATSPPDRDNFGPKTPLWSLLLFFNEDDVDPPPAIIRSHKLFNSLLSVSCAPYGSKCLCPAAAVAASTDAGSAPELDNRRMELKSRLLYGEIIFPSNAGGIGGRFVAASGLFLTLVEGADKGRFLLELFVLVVWPLTDPGVVGGVLAVGAVIVGGVVAVVRDKK